MTAIRYLPLAALLAASSLSATAALANGYSDGVEIRPPVEGVTIYTVSSEPLPEEQPAPPAPAIQVNTIVNVVLVERSSRWEQYHRALGQRYLGFFRMYAGPRYPF
jgi:hypothetical protein